MSKFGRNTPCHCGSGKKYKKCCLQKDEKLQQSELQAQQYEQDVRSGRIDPFASEEDWEEPDEDWQDEWDEEDEDDFDSESDISPASTSERIAPPEMAEKELSAEEDEIINAWFDAYKDISDPDELRSHIENFMDSHPDLIVDLDLAKDPLLELELMYVRQNRHKEYIEMLSRLRSEFPDAYTKGFASFDNSIISWMVMTDQKQKVAEYLTNFSKYPSTDPDKLFDTIHFLMSSNCQDILADFIPDICHEVCTSPMIMNGGAILNPMIALIMAPFLDLGLDGCDPVKLTEEIKRIEDLLNPVWVDPQFLKIRLEFILGRHERWSLDGCRARNQAVQRYDEMTYNFMGWLHANKGLDWCAAVFYRQLIFDYQFEALPENKKPREHFPFEEKNMQRLVVSLSQSIFWLDPIRLFGLLNGLYWFIEFLEDTLSLAPEHAKLHKESCVRFFEEVYPAQREQDFKALAWEKFPREK